MEKPDQKMKAKVKDWRLDVVTSTKTREQLDVVKVTLEGEDGHDYEYTGWLTDASSVQKTVAALSVCGFRGSDLISLGSGAAGGALAAGTEVRITIGEKSGNAGRVFKHAKYIDPLTGADKFEATFDKQAQQDRLRKLRADVIASQQGAVDAIKNAGAKPAVTKDDLPF